MVETECWQNEAQRSKLGIIIIGGGTKRQGLTCTRQIPLQNGLPEKELAFCKVALKLITA